jgi:hypothetical protein
MNLKDVMRAADQFHEPQRDQTGILDGAVEVVMVAVLDRTVVIELNGERLLVAHHRLDVDDAKLAWQPKEQMTAKEAYRLRRTVRSKSA